MSDEFLRNVSPQPRFGVRPPPIFAAGVFVLTVTSCSWVSRCAPRHRGGLVWVTVNGCARHLWLQIAQSAILWAGLEGGLWGDWRWSVHGRVVNLFGGWNWLGRFRHANFFVVCMIRRTNGWWRRPGCENGNLKRPIRLCLVCRPWRVPERMSDRRPGTGHTDRVGVQRPPIGVTVSTLTVGHDCVVVRVDGLGFWRGLPPVGLSTCGAGIPADKWEVHGFCFGCFRTLPKPEVEAAGEEEDANWRVTSDGKADKYWKQNQNWLETYEQPRRQSR